MAARRTITAVMATGLVALTGAALMSPAAGAAQQDLAARVSDAQGNSLGLVRFGDDDGKVLVKARLSGLAAGFHGFHVHAKGICDASAVDAAGNPSPFLTAAGHYNPAGTTHGTHAGDMTPLLVAADGTATLRFTTDRFTLEQLTDADGSAVIVHAGPDNLGHIPATTASGAERYHSHIDAVLGPDSATRGTGDAGSRAGCGVIDAVDG